MDGLTGKEVIRSLNVFSNKDTVFQAGQGEGRSGSFFFFSRDNRLIIKTIKKDERNVLLNILDSYMTHLTTTQGRSMLARIYGIFKVKTSFYATIDVLIMQNIANLLEPDQKLYSFDLKGSIVDRYVNFNKRKLREFALQNKENADDV